MHSIQNYHFEVKSAFWGAFMNKETDEHMQVPPSPHQKPYPEGAMLVDLVSPEDLTVGEVPLVEAIRNRRTQRVYAEHQASAARRVCSKPYKYRNYRQCKNR